MKHFGAALLLCCGCTLGSAFGGEQFAPGAEKKPLALAWPGEKNDLWHGCRRHVFPFDGTTCWVVEPKQPLPGNPWTWCMEFPDAFTDRTGVPKLLEKGVYHLYMDLGNSFGSPPALKHIDNFYVEIVSKGLAAKGTLIGISRGGLYAYNWAALHPDKVLCIYGDAPVCDFKSWPGGKGKGKGSPGDWASLMKLYGFKNEAEALAYPGNPVDSLAPLARARVELIHVVGDADDVVPPAENTELIEQRYTKLGGGMKVVHKPGGGHHPHGLDDPTPIVDFILYHAVGKVMAAAAPAIAAAAVTPANSTVVDSCDTLTWTATKPNKLGLTLALDTANQHSGAACMTATFTGTPGEGYAFISGLAGKDWKGKTSISFWYKTNNPTVAMNKGLTIIDHNGHYFGLQMTGTGTKDWTQLTFKFSDFVESGNGKDTLDLGGIQALQYVETSNSAWTEQVWIDEITVQ